MKYWSSLPHTEREQTEAWLEAMIAIPPAEGEDFVIEYQGRVIGKAGLYRFPAVGYILHPDYWGRGFAGEALGAVIGRAFAVHGLSQLKADVDPRNEASLRLLKRLGFTETGREQRTWLIGGLWYDSIYLGLDRRDWNPTGG
jgi:ribosomal-protein-alanine N-acetyltransferase